MNFSDACTLSCYPNILLIIICSVFTLGVCYDSLFCGAFLDCCSSKSAKCLFGFTDQHIKIFPNPQLSFSMLCTILSVSISAELQANVFWKSCFDFAGWPKKESHCQSLSVVLKCHYSGA